MTRRLTSLLVLLSFVSTSVPTLAEADEETATKVRVTTFLLDHPNIEDAVLVPGMRQLDDALRRNPRLEMKDLDTRLADFAQEVPSDEIEAGRKQLADGTKFLIDHELPSAAKQLRTAIDTLSKMLPYIKKQELAEAMMSYAVTLCESGDKRGCRAQFQRVLTWRTDQKYETGRFPDRYLALFEEVRKELDKGKRGMLEIRSDPPAAEAFVDGKYVGVTPTAAEGLLVGEHFITIKKGGFRKSVQAAMVSGKVQGTVDFKLERSGKYLLVEEAMRAAEKEMGHDTLDNELDNLKEVLFLDQAVFVRARRVARGRVRVETHLYDLRTHRRLATETHEMADSDVDKQLAAQAAALYMNVKYDAELEAPKDEPVPLARRRRQPIYKKWWFWTVVGVAAVGVGVTTGVLVEKYKPQACGDNNYCPGFSF
ncbi:MAG: PEGA domain-containing protein [Polyangia bacterium]